MWTSAWVHQYYSFLGCACGVITTSDCIPLIYVSFSCKVRDAIEKTTDDATAKYTEDNMVLKTYYPV